MRRILQTALAISLVAGSVGTAHAISPIDFVQRFLANPANVFGRTPGVKPRPKPAPETPLLSVPLPHLRPTTATAVPPLGYQPDDADDGIDAIATDDMPLPRLRPKDLLPALTQTAPAAKPTQPAPKVAALPNAALPDLTERPAIMPEASAR